jgi:excisionase family DNA binding protein
MNEMITSNKASGNDAVEELRQLILAWHHAARNGVRLRRWPDGHATNGAIGNLSAILGLIPPGQIPAAIAWLSSRLMNSAPAQASPPVDVKPEPLLTVPEVAQQLRLAKGFVYELIRQGQIAAIPSGKKHIRVTRQAVEAYKNRHSTGIDLRK